MSDEMRYSLFILEHYKIAHGIKGADAYALFKEDGVFNWISKYYNALHTMGTRQVLDEIDEKIFKS